ncbi:hypothetical protein BDN72DRAFT_902696 [Pluteus cervinus]|uniref:Uncharacterized protein n=1 Tax=Pluteus cervinus TaxID=181527 RepID=A0ACD3ACE5_9AGAR|nr:hypothetical protein BDN72DRAFT_902696 [Pluteus cervinus]
MRLGTCRPIGIRHSALDVVALLVTFGFRALMFSSQVPTFPYASTHHLVQFERSHGDSKPQPAHRLGLDRSIGRVKRAALTGAFKTSTVQDGIRNAESIMGLLAW